MFWFFLIHSLTQVIRKFAKQLDEWLKIALHDLPENLRNIKFECKCLHFVIVVHFYAKYAFIFILKKGLKDDRINYHFVSPFLFPVSRRFSQILKRQTSLNHLCQVPIMF